MEFTESPTPLPRWMEKMKQKEELDEARADAVAQRAIAARLQIASDGPAFWNGFVKELQVQATMFDQTGIRGSVSPAGVIEGEAYVHIEIALKDSLWPSITNANFFYRRGNRGIRSASTLDRNVPSFEFQVFRDGLRAVSDHYSGGRTAEEVAEYVLERMVSIVKARREVSYV